MAESSCLNVLGNISSLLQTGQLSRTVSAMTAKRAVDNSVAVEPVSMPQRDQEI